MPFGCLETGDSLYENGSGELEVQLASASGLEIVAGEGLSIVSTGTEWWEELGRTTLSVAGTSITVNAFSPRKYLKVIYILLPSGALNLGFRFNNDSGSNYSYVYSGNMAAGTTATATANGTLSNLTTAIQHFGEINVINNTATEKIARVVGGNAGGGTTPANAPGNFDCTVKWANTSALISRFDVFTVTNNFAVGSQAVILGHD